MSDAQVRYLTLDYKETTPDKAERFSFQCPKYKRRRCSGLIIAGRTDLKRDGTGQNGTPMWDMSGDPQRPTFSPSINCKGCWHGFIENGRCVNVAKIDEPEPA